MLVFLLVFLLLCPAVFAEESLEAPFPAGSAGASVADIAAKALNRLLHLTDGADPAAAADTMLQTPGCLLCADQAVLISGLQGYTSADLRTAMRPVCRIASSPLYLVMNTQAAGSMGIQDAKTFLDYISAHEYELFLARHIRADVIDRAVTKLSDALPVLTEYFLEEEIPEVLAVGDAHAALVSGIQLAEGDETLLPLFSLSSERTDAFPDLPCASELDVPVCDGISFWVFASADMDDASVEKASSACLALPPESVNAVPGLSYAPLAGDALSESIRGDFADYKEYMTSEGLFFYEE